SRLGPRDQHAGRLDDEDRLGARRAIPARMTMASPRAACYGSVGAMEERFVQERALSLAEEIANSVTHGIGLLASLVGLPILVVAAAGRAGAMHVVGCSVFAASLVALYAASTIYHALPPSRAKQVFRVIDHVAIYLLIAGTYTPFTLGVLRGAWGWTLFGMVWSLAAAGIVFKTLLGLRYPRAS